MASFLARASANCFACCNTANSNLRGDDPRLFQPFGMCPFYRSGGVHLCGGVHLYSYLCRPIEAKALAGAMALAVGQSGTKVSDGKELPGHPSLCGHNRGEISRIPDLVSGHFDARTRIEAAGFFASWTCWSIPFSRRV
jgi:hypothetical protein